MMYKYCLVCIIVGIDDDLIIFGLISKIIMCYSKIMNSMCIPKNISLEHF